MLSKYIWHKKDITFPFMMVIERVVRLIAQKEGKCFDEVYGHFLGSKTYSALQRVKNDYWAESAEFLVDEYYREKMETDHGAQI
ncbi:MAG: hypothetical protein Ta2B_05800 [Termitinemataceae bacterium]|nr:MAG: hypothetical protein Ta2B_05800 [Termitinemataceae bacterium]